MSKEEKFYFRTSLIYIILMLIETLAENVCGTIMIAALYICHEIRNSRLW